MYQQKEVQPYEYINETAQSGIQHQGTKNGKNHLNPNIQQYTEYQSQTKQQHNAI